MRGLSRTVCVAALAVLLACTASDDDGEQDTALPVLTGGLFVYSFVRTGDTLQLLGDSTRCAGGALVRDTVRRVALARVEGDSLEVTFTDSLRQGAVAAHVLQCVRRDTTTGLEGEWMVVGRRTTLAGGQLSGSDQERLARDTAMADSMIAQEGFTMLFRNGMVAGTFEGVLVRVLLPVVMADPPEFVRVTVDTGDDSVSARITGHFTGETVTVRFDGHLNRHFTCSPPNRAAYTDWQRVESCGETEWFGAFLRDNVSFADEFMHMDGIRNLDVQLDVLVEKVADDTVRVTGRRSGEVITVVCSRTGTVTFTSTDERHADYSTPRDPYVVLPIDWWAQFCNENLYP